MSMNAKETLVKMAECVWIRQAITFAAVLLVTKLVN